MSDVELVPTFRTRIEQCTHYHDDGTPFYHLIEVLTDGSAYHSEEELELWSEEGRASFAAWLSDVHDAEVELAEEPPEVRELAGVLRERLVQNLDPASEADHTRTAIREARSIVAHDEYQAVVAALAEEYPDAAGPCPRAVVDAFPRRGLARPTRSRAGL